MLRRRRFLHTRASMQTIGERLLEARQRRGVSIREAAESTKVRGDYLAAMENNQFDSIPLADVYRRGFLKIYARFMRLDSERVVNDYNALLAARSPGSVRVRRATDSGEAPARSIEPREPEAPDEFSSGAIEVAERPDNRRKHILIIGGVSLAAIVIIGLVFSRSGSGKPASSESSSVETTAPVSSSEGEVTFISGSQRAVSVRVTRADGQEVFSQVVQPGGSATMRASGALTVTATDKVSFRINGGGLLSFRAGALSASITVPEKGR